MQILSFFHANPTRHLAGAAPSSEQDSGASRARRPSRPPATRTHSREESELALRRVGALLLLVLVAERTCEVVKMLKLCERLVVLVHG